MPSAAARLVDIFIQTKPKTRKLVHSFESERHKEGTSTCVASHLTGQGYTMRACVLEGRLVVGFCTIDTQYTAV